VARLLPLAVVLALLACGGACRPRANPMLTGVTKSVGVAAPVELASLSLRYDEEFHPVEVERAEGDVRERWELVWNGTRLTQVTREVKRAGTPQLLELAELTYQGSKLKQIFTDTGDRSERTTTFSYDTGRLAKIDVEAAAPGFFATTRQAFRYDEDKNLIEVKTNLTVNEEERPEVELTLSFQNGKPIRIVRSAQESAATTTTSVVYDEGRLSSFTAVFDAGDPEIEEQTSSMVFDYDKEGRIVSAVIPVPDEEDEEQPEEDDVRFAFTYEDAEAEHLDITPYAFLGIPLPMWDLRGGATSAIIDDLQGPRLLELLW
jgi:hypothetical protein